MGSLGPGEMIVLGVLALLVFGPKRLPEIGRHVGAALREFRKASRDLMSHFEDDYTPPRVRSVDRTAYGSYPTDYSATHDAAAPGSENKDGHAA